MKHRFIFSAVFAIQSFCLTFTVAQGGVQQLVRSISQQEEYKNGAVKVLYESDISLEDAVLINDFLSTNVAPEPVLVNPG